MITEKISYGSTIQGPAGKIYVEDNGRDAGLPIVFVHSFGGSTKHWREQVEHIGPKRRTITFDSRAHGRSASPAPFHPDYYSEAGLAEDIDAVAKGLHLRRFILIGHSQGSLAAIKYAADNPKKVAGLLLTGTPGKVPADQADSILSSLKSDQYEKVMTDYVNQLLIDAKPSVNTLVTEGFKSIPRDVTLALVETLFRSDVPSLIADYNGPVLLILTAHENEQPTQLAKQVTDTPFKIIDNASHWVQLDKPGEFNTILDDFMNAIDRLG